MATLREQILARVAAALNGQTPAGANVFRAREVAITRGVSPAITVLFDGETDERMGDVADKHWLRINIAIFVRGDPWDSLADAIAEPMHRVLMTDAPLRALILDIRLVSSEPEAEEADRTAGVLKAVYLVTYVTKASDLAAQPT